ncbi:MAG: c-type cytochrome [Planctomycetota bacterium]
MKRMPFSWSFPAVLGAAFVALAGALLIVDRCESQEAKSAAAASQNQAEAKSGQPNASASQPGAKAGKKGAGAAARAAAKKAAQAAAQATGKDGMPLTEPPATPVDQLKVAKGFRVELLYSVPRDVEGSWVNMCVMPDGRLIVCDQYGGLFRVTPPKLGSADATKIEKLAVDIGEAQGLLWAFDSLYVVVNKGQRYESGLYRVRDTNGDGQLDKVEYLRALTGGGEHGPHAVLPTPDGKSLYVVCGNQSKMTELSGSRVPKLWGEDHLLPRMPDGRGFMRGVLGPGGCIYQIDPDGKSWELIGTGFRNQFDAAVNRHGDIFTYDADMEWDINTPWYRPTRVCLVTSGAEFGWRNGAGKWPVYYPDSLPAITNIGPGSPTGVVFGYGAKFPAKYQEALYICDWSYGKLYALHLTPQGSAYSGVLEEFISGSPLPLTDLVVNPTDGALYFAIGGRRTKSGLYRVTYVGGEATAPSQTPDNPAATEARALRRKLESFHGRVDTAAVDAAWPHLKSADRFIRFAARTAIEHQPLSGWADRALSETEPRIAIAALLALARAGGSDPFHRPADAPPVDAVLRGKLLAALAKLDWNTLTVADRVELLRVYHIALNRLGPPTATERDQLIALLEPRLPTTGREANVELANVLIYLQSPTAAVKTVALMAAAPTQEEQIDYARALRVLKAGWTPESRKTYFEWFLKAASYKGGASFALFVQNIKRDALETLSEAEKLALKEIIEAIPPADAKPTPAPPRPIVKQWTLAELNAIVDQGLKGRDFDRGRALFAAANCFACHRYDNEGGAVGPDLTQLAGRFSAREILESVVEPSKVISDQYQAVTIVTEDGKAVTGRIVNLSNNNLMVSTNMLEPGSLTTVDARLVESINPSKLSMMPEGLLNTLRDDEVRDLLAYLLSRGDREHAMFKK